jgi:hypothetical protein
MSRERISQGLLRIVVTSTCGGKNSYNEMRDIEEVFLKS